MEDHLCDYLHLLAAQSASKPDSCNFHQGLLHRKRPLALHCAGWCALGSRNRGKYVSGRLQRRNGHSGALHQQIQEHQSRQTHTYDGCGHHFIFTFMPIIQERRYTGGYDYQACQRCLRSDTHHCKQLHHRPLSFRFKAVSAGVHLFQEI